MINDCLMCENPKYTWYEVLRDTCGKYPNPGTALKQLCDVHQQIATEDLMEKMGTYRKDAD